MYLGKKCLALIPARGGSKGVPQKNIREVAGRPLIAWTIVEAKKSKYIDSLVLSSDDNMIAKIAKDWGCDVPFTRPTELARDETPGIDVVLHALEKLPEYDYLILLQPTTPLRTVQDIDGCFEFFIQQKANVCVSVSEVSKTPYWMYTLNEENHMNPILDTNFPRRQDCPKVYSLNGVLYIADTRWLMQNRAFVTEETLAYQMSSSRSLDIDTEWDMKLCENILSASQNDSNR